MTRSIFHFSMALLSGLMLAVVTLYTLPRFQPAQAVGESLTVCPAGPPACDYSVIQAAVDAADDGDVIKVAAGTYTEVSVRTGLTQVAYINKSLTLRGGYSPPNWSDPDPAAHTTILDAQGHGRVVLITGPHTVTVEGLHLTGGRLTGHYEEHGFGAGPDLGADEGQPALLISKEAEPDPVWPGEQITYTVHVTNTGYVDLHLVITDTLPGEVVPGGVHTWTAVLPAAGGRWSQDIVAAVAPDATGPLVNRVKATSQEGAAGSYQQRPTVGRRIYLPVIGRSR